MSKARLMPDSLIRKAAQMLLSSASADSEHQKGVRLGVKCMRDMMLATTSLKRKYGKP